MRKTRNKKASNDQSTASRLAPLVAEMARDEGVNATRLADVKVMRAMQCYPRGPVAYEPGIFIVVQGSKTGYLGRRKFVYDPNNYLVLAVPLPFECQVEASAEAPMLAVKIGVTPATVAELLMQLEQPASAKRKRLQAIEATPLDEMLSNCTQRLLESLRSDDDARILGPQIVREITYRVLMGPLGHNLRALAAPHTHFGQISRVLNRIHADYSRALEIATLARDAGMSLSTFHAHFKAVTSSSPLQYLKNVRLHRARMLMVHEGANAATAASRVGYESASQFSREFKRLFGDGPAAVATQLRRSLIRLA